MRSAPDPRATPPARRAGDTAWTTVPVPRERREPAGRGFADERGPTSARVLLDDYRQGGTFPIDVVGFDAACPACGGPAQWVQEREDTRVRSTITCSDPDCR